MADFSDPLTDTTWLDTSDIPGSVMTSVVALVGLGILFTMISVAQSTVTPLIADVLGMVPGVNTGDAGSGLDFSAGGGGL